jgi:bifunctional NMN adenylyltransferase/nudix hydrolase
MKEVEKKYDVGVIIGRFQIHKLHSEHQKLIEHVTSRHDKVIIFLGVAPAASTRKNPLDFLSRKVMIEELYADKISYIAPLNDMKRDDDWAKQVDSKVREIVPMGSVVLYGSKDSFIPYYAPHGKFDTCELEPDNFISATDIRNDIKNKVLRSEEFRAGMIYAANSTFPHNFATVDIAIFNDAGELLLGRKPNEKKFRFVGGFSDVTDSSYEHTAKREGNEESGLEIGNIQYVCSKKVDDWRYRGITDRGIITILYKAKKVFGAAKPNDDIEEVKWVSLDELFDNELVDEHQHLLNELRGQLALEYVKENNINIKN